MFHMGCPAEFESRMPFESMHVLVHLEGCLNYFFAVTSLIIGGKMLPSQVVQVQVRCKMLGRILLCQRF